jgi:hypothetical protein
MFVVIIEYLKARIISCQQADSQFMPAAWKCLYTLLVLLLADVCSMRNAWICSKQSACLIHEGGAEWLIHLLLWLPPSVCPWCLLHDDGTSRSLSALWAATGSAVHSREVVLHDVVNYAVLIDLCLLNCRSCHGHQLRDSYEQNPVLRGKWEGAVVGEELVALYTSELI